MNRLLFIATLAFCVLGPLTAQSQPRADRDAFEAAVTKIDTDVAEAQRNFSRVLEPFQDGQPGDPAEVRAAYDRLAGAVQGALDQSATLKTPDSDDYRAFFVALRGFLSVVHEQVQPELEKVVAKVEEKQGKLDLLSKLEVIASLEKCDEIQQPLRNRLIDAARTIGGVPKTTDRDAFEKAVKKMGGNLDDARRNFSNVLQPFIDGKPGDPAALRSAYDRFAGAVQTALNQSATLAPDAHDRQDFLVAFQNFLRTVQDSVQPEMEKVVTNVEKNHGKLDLVGQLETMASLKKCDEALKTVGERLESAGREMERADKTTR